VFGPTIVYDAERCIVCTRCVRFSEEVALDPVLSVRERGNVNEIVVAPGRELDHDYTLMTEHVCPVGALTSKDFRFKARVWFLRTARTVCQNCATGCNAYMDYDPRNNTAYRHRPRENMEVNKYWMCDQGMLDYRRVHEDRLLDSRIGGEVVKVGTALDRAAELLRGVDPSKTAVLLSGQHSMEDNFAVLELAKQLGITQLFATGRPAGKSDKILKHADKNSNTAGVLSLTAPRKPLNFMALSNAIQAGGVTHLLALGDGIEDESLAPSLRKLKALVLIGTWNGPLSEAAHVVLPASSWAEADGLFMNAKGMVQESEQAIEPVGQSRPAWKLAAAIGVRSGVPVPFKSLQELRTALSGASPKSRRQEDAGVVQ
jgi:NADH-quinone oxidoreductase subunit G